MKLIISPVIFEVEKADKIKKLVRHTIKGKKLLNKTIKVRNAQAFRMGFIFLRQAQKRHATT